MTAVAPRRSEPTYLVLGTLIGGATGIVQGIGFGGSVPLALVLATAAGALTGAAYGAARARQTSARR